MYLINLETARLAKENGYPFHFKEIQGEEVPMNIPTIYELAKWLREDKGIHVMAIPGQEGRWHYECGLVTGRHNFYQQLPLGLDWDDINSSFEAAFEDGLAAALQWLKDN